MKADYIRNTTKMVVLKDLVTNKTRSFIMVFVGSYDYLTRSRNMGRNSYLYREPDYDGMVLYYAINGTFINGWRYSNGKLVGYISPSYNEQGESSVQTRGYQDCHDVYTTEYRQDCHDEYELVGGDMETGLHLIKIVIMLKIVQVIMMMMTTGGIILILREEQVMKLIRLNLGAIILQKLKRFFAIRI